VTLFYQIVLTLQLVLCIFSMLFSIFLSTASSWKEAVFDFLLILAVCSLVLWLVVAMPLKWIWGWA